MSLKIIVKNSVNWSQVGIKRVFSTHPKFSSACTGFITFSVGDVLAQKLEHGEGKSLDLKRSLKLGLLGFVMNGVFLHSWFTYLDKVVGTCMKTKATVLYKVLADQVVYAPFAIIAYFSYATATKSSSVEPSVVTKQATEVSPSKMSFVDKLHNDFWPTFTADCTIWPLANVVNFRYVPLLYRATFTSVVSLLWQTYMSAVAYFPTGGNTTNITVVSNVVTTKSNEEKR
jgi:protein Mpv17